MFQCPSDSFSVTAPLLTTIQRPFELRQQKMTNYNQKQYFVLQIGTKTSRGTKENKENSFVEGITFELDSEDQEAKSFPFHFMLEI